MSTRFKLIAGTSAEEVERRANDFVAALPSGAWVERSTVAMCPPPPPPAQVFPGVTLTQTAPSIALLLEYHLPPRKEPDR